MKKQLILIILLVLTAVAFCSGCKATVSMETAKTASAVLADNRDMITRYQKKEEVAEIEYKAALGDIDAARTLIKEELEK